MGEKVGLEAKFYYNGSTLLDGGSNTPGSLSWTEDQNVKEVNLNTEAGTADMTTRGSNGWRNVLVALKEGSIELTKNFDSADAAYQALRDAYNNRTEIAGAVMSGDINTSGEEGLASNYVVTNFSRSEPLEDGMTVSITLSPSSHTEWYKP